MRVTRRGKAKRALQQDLPRGRIEQVGAAHHVGDALRGVVDHHRELVGPVAVGTLEHEVADLFADVLAHAPLDRIVEAECGGGRHAQPEGRRGAHGAGNALAMDAAVVGEVAAAAVAGKSGARCEQAVECGLIDVATFALAQHRAVGMQSERRQRAQLLPGGARDLTRRVEVLDPHQPFATGAPRQQPAAECRQQRTEMQRPGRRGREAAAITGAGRGGWSEAHMGPGSGCT